MRGFRLRAKPSDINTRTVELIAFRPELIHGTARKLVGFELIDRGIPRHGYEVVDADMNVIGVVTSGTQSPTLNKPIGMAYVPAAQSKAGSEILVNIRGKAIKGVVTKMPFVQG